MVYVKLVTNTMYVGTRNIELETFDKDELSTGDRRYLDEKIGEMAIENGESYAWNVEEEDYDEYIDDCVLNSYWAEITEEEYNELKEEGY